MEEPAEEKNWKACATKKQMDQYFQFLGSRPYDEIDKSDLFQLKKKVCFATCGEPDDLPSCKNYYTGYKAESLNHVKTICNKIISISGEGPIRFACTILILNHKGSKGETPVFRILTSNGQVFIDAQARVYPNWVSFMKNNKLPDCEYCYPVNGEYNENNQQVRFTFSPASKKFNKFLDHLDTVGSVAALGAAGVFAVGAVAAVAPVAMATAGVTAACTGAYSFTRSVGSLHDRKKHDQPIGLKDREARSAWLNIGSSLACVSTIRALGSAKKVAESGKTLSKTLSIGLKALSTTTVIFSGFGFVESLVICVDEYKKGTMTKKHVFDLSCEILFFANAIFSHKATNNLVNSMNTAVAENPSVQKKLTKTQKRNLRRRAAKRRAKGLAPINTSEKDAKGISINGLKVSPTAMPLLVKFATAFNPRLEELCKDLHSIGHDIACWKSKEMPTVILLLNLSKTANKLFKQYREEIEEALPKIHKFFKSLEKIWKGFMSKFENAEEFMSTFENAEDETKKLFCTKVINVEDELEAVITEAEREVYQCYEDLGIEVINKSSDLSEDDDEDHSDFSLEVRQLLSKCLDVISEASLSCKELVDFGAVLEEVKSHVVAQFKREISEYKKCVRDLKDGLKDSFDIDTFHNEAEIEGDLVQFIFESTLKELTNTLNIDDIKTKLKKEGYCQHETTMCTPVWESAIEGLNICFGPHKGGDLRLDKLLPLVSKVVGTPLSFNNLSLQHENIFLFEKKKDKTPDSNTVLAFKSLSPENTASLIIFTMN